MQAYRLRVADRHHTQVVKVCVEPRSNCAALLLADSSCILVSLSSLPAIRRTLIPAPCTDVCFLRLQARVLAGGGSTLPSRTYPVERGASGGISTSGGDPRENNAKMGQGDGGEPGKGTSRAGVRGRSVNKLLGNGKGVTANIRTRVYFLISQPAKGGSCIDLHAWHCEAPSFSPANAELDRSATSCRGPESTCLDHDPQGRLVRERRAVRLDIPHGMVMKMAASINVVIVYSISAGKIWVLAAKHVGPPELQKDQGSRSFRGSGFSPMERDLDTGLSTTKAENGLDGGSCGYLLLMKCAVLECSKPVYSLYASPQHLLLGESGGVWIWPLRPLIKSDKRHNEKERPKESTVRLQSSRALAATMSKVQLEKALKESTRSTGMRASNGELSCISTCQVKEWPEDTAINERRNFEDQKLHSLVTTGDISEWGHNSKNGLYASEEEEEEQVKRVYEGSATNGAAPKNGFHETEKKLCLVVNTNCFGNGYVSELNPVKWDSSLEVNGHHEDGKAAGNMTRGLPSVGQQAPDITQKHTAGAARKDLQGLLAGAHHYKEEADVLGERAITESHWKAGIVQKRNGIVSLSGNSHEPLYSVEGSQSYSSGSEGIGSLETETPFEDTNLSYEIPLARVKQQQDLGPVGPLYVTTSKERREHGFMAGKGMLQAQVVDIQEITPSRFVVLDSSGDLHLLAMEDVQDRGTRSPLRGSHPKMTSLKAPIKVSSMGVLLPAVQSTTREPPGPVVERKMWISDGRYSSYIVIIPSDSSGETAAEVRIADTGHTAALPVTVSETVFTSERVDTVAAVSSETVLVMTQGSVIAYVISGS